MRKFLVIALLILCCSAAFAQPDALHSFELTGGAGWSNIGYKIADMRQTGAVGGMLHAGYNIHLTRWMSLGIGVDVESDGAVTRGDLFRSWTDVTDTDGERYEHRLQLNDWSERGRVWLLQIPVALQFIVPAQKVSFSVQVGAKWGTKIGGSVNTNGTTVHTGYYEPWHLTLSDMETYGFYSARYKQKQPFPASVNSTWHVFGKLGILTPLTSKLYFTAHIYADYSLTDLLKNVSSEKPLGVRNDKEGMEYVHYFMPEYTSLLDTEAADLGNSKLLNVGLEIGLRYVIVTRKRSAHSRKYPCRCLMD
ncbi:MAG: hypothetical protein IJ776_11430 [Paludibacteraceae bacterium]|nr:hypothetical protein [Paludibacteraceae bacterium]